MGGAAEIGQVREAAWEMTTWELPLPPMLLMSAPARVCKTSDNLGDGVVVVGQDGGSHADDPGTAIIKELDGLHVERGHNYL